MRIFREGFLRGMGFALGVAVFLAFSVLLAQTFHTFQSGDLISASSLNETFTYLRSRVDSPLPLVESASSGGSGNVTTTGWTDVTNLSVTVTTAGSPVWVGINSSTTGQIEVGAPSVEFVQGFIRITRDGSEIARFPVFHRSSGAPTVYTTIPPSSVWHLDNPGAGTYTYTIQARVAGLGAGNYINLNNCKLIAARFNET